MPSQRYQVRSGDTLYAIAEHYKVTVTELARVNAIRDANHIVVGQVLKIPAGPRALPSWPRTHRVETGEILYGIARRYGVTVAALSRANGISDPARIRVGQTLSIPEARLPEPTAVLANPHAPGQVIFGFHNDFPSPHELASHMAGFDRWALFTLERPVVELEQHRQRGAMPFDIEFSAPAPEPHEDPRSSLAVDGAATGAFLRATWPYYYRFLASYDPGLAQIMAGQPLVPKAPNGGPAAFQPAATRAEMTFRHTRPGGNVLTVGTDRISTGNNLVRIAAEAKGRGTGQVVRIDPEIVNGSGRTFLSSQDVLEDLNEFEQVTRQQLTEAIKSGRGRNFLQRLENRLNAIEQARKYVRGYGEGHGVGEIPRQPSAESNRSAGRWPPCGRCRGSASRVAS